MKKYYYADGSDQVGPFDFEELKGKGIKADTLIWFEGLDGWKKASEIDELKTLLLTGPPPINQPEKAVQVPPQLPNAKPTETPKKSNKVRNIILISSAAVILITGCILLAFKEQIFYTYQPSTSSTTSSYTSTPPTNNTASSTENNSENNGGNNSSQDDRSNTPEYIDPSAACDAGACEGGGCDDGQYERGDDAANDAYEEILRKEENAPVDYLWVSYDLTFKMLSGKHKITGEIHNNAAFAAYKDVKLRVEYLSKTNTRLEFEDYYVYNWVMSGGSIPFTIEVVSPAGTSKIGVEVVGASPW